MLAMWLATVFVLTERSCAIWWLLWPLASWVKISSSRSVRAARIAVALLLLVLTGDLAHGYVATAFQRPVGKHGFPGGGGLDCADDHVGSRVLRM